MARKVRTFGDWKDIEPGARGVLSYQQMTLGASHLTGSWERCSVSADFWAGFITLHTNKKQDQRIYSHALASKISYLLNELFENCAKFSQGTPDEIRYHSWIFPNHIIVQMRNHILPDQAANFMRQIEEWSNNDLDELYLKKIGRINEKANDFTGLGYITLMRDEYIRFGFRFEQISAFTTTVDIQALIELESSNDG